MVFTLLHTVTHVLPLSSIELWKLFTKFDTSKGSNGVPSPIGVWVGAGSSISDRPSKIVRRGNLVLYSSANNIFDRDWGPSISHSSLSTLTCDKPGSIFVHGN